MGTNGRPEQARRKGGSPVKKIISILAVIVFVCVFLPLRFPGTASDSLTGLRVHFLDVGQGDCAIIQCDGEAMVIDGGPKDASQYVYAYIRDTLKLTHLDYVVSTHPHGDHIGGLAAVLNAVPADLVLTPVTEWDSRDFRSMKACAARQGAALAVPAAGDVLQLGRAVVTVLHCWPEAIREGRANDASIVLRVDFGKTSFLFTGDAEDWSEYMMLDAGACLRADVLKVSHHGSGSACTGEFLQAVQPKCAVISVGEGNDYGHPHGSVLRRLASVNCTVLRTDELGTVVLESDGNSITARAGARAQ